MNRSAAGRGKLMGADVGFDVFLSHASVDKTVVEQIAEALLERYGLHCWIDVWTIPAAADWEREIDAGLRACRACLVVLGPNGWGPFHLREARMAWAMHESRSDFVVVPVTLPGVKEEDLSTMPSLFDRRQRIEYEARVEVEALERIAKSVRAEGAPFPLGRPRMSPYTIRRDARRFSVREDRSILYQGAQLKRARALAEQYPGHLDQEALRFLKLSGDAERSRARRLVRWVAGATLLLMALTVYSIVMRVRAERLSMESRANGLAYLSRAIGDEDPTRAIRVAELALGLDSECIPARATMMELGIDRYHYKVVAERGVVTSLSTTPDGRLLAAAGHDGSVGIYDLSTGSQIASRGTGFRHVTDVAFMPDGDHIVIATYNHGTSIHSVTGDHVVSLHEPGTVVFAVAAAPNGSHVYTGTLSGRVTAWDTTSGSRFVFPETEGNCQALALNDDGSLLAAGFFGGGGVVWTTDGRVLARLTIPRKSAGVRSLLFLADDLLLGGARDGSLLLWRLSMDSEAQSPKSEPAERFAAHTRDVYGLARLSGRLFASVGGRVGKVWEVPTRFGRHPLRSVAELRGHTNQLRAVQVAGGKLITAGYDGLLRRWTRTPWPRSAPEGYNRHGSWHPREPLCLLSHARGIGIWDPRSNDVAIVDHDFVVNCARFTTDGTRIVAGGHDGRVSVTSLETGARRGWRCGDADVRALSVHGRDESLRIAIGTDDGRATLWTASGEMLRTVSTHETSVEVAELSPSGDSMLVFSLGEHMGKTLGQDGGLWSLDGRQHHAYAGAVGRHSPRAAFSPSGRHFLTTVHVLGEKAEPPDSYHRGGSRAVLLGLDGTGIRRFDGHEGGVRSVAISPNAQFVATACKNRSQIWDSSGTRLHGLESGGPGVSVSFSSDSGQLLVVERRRAYVLPMPHVVSNWLKSASVHRLTDAETESLLTTGAFP